jgi:small subunit ribosomal protein S1
MSDIREPAQSDSPTTPGDEGKSNASEPIAVEASPATAAPAADSSPEGGEASPEGGEASPEGGEASPEGGEASSEGGEASSEGGEGQGRRRNRKRNRGPRGEGAEGRSQGGQGGAAQGAQPRAFKSGDKVRARVIEVLGATAVLDLWGKEKGLIDLREVQGEDGSDPAVGDGFDVEVIQDGSRGGSVVVTRDPERVQKGRAFVKEALESGAVVHAIVTGMNKGGLELDLNGVRAFCPTSQVDVRFPPSVSPKSLLNQRFECKVTALADDGREAIVSRRALVEASVRARAEELRTQIKPGDVVKGVVTSVKDYGVFVDLGGIEGLIHITELSHNRGARPHDVCKVGDEVEAKVLKITSGEARKPDGSNRQEPPATAGEATAGEPAEATAGEATAEATAGESVEATAGDSATDEAGDATAGAGEASEVAAAGAKAEGRGDRKRRDRERDRDRGPRRDPGPALPRVMLSRRAVERDPWEEAQKHFPVGSVHTGKVARMQPFGAFIELVSGVDGLLHVSELGQGRRIEHPQEVLTQGQTVTVKVERVEKANRRIALSLLPDGVTREQLDKAVNVRVGMVTKATVVEHEGPGFHAALEGVIGKLAKGYVHERDSAQPRGTDLRKALPIGTVINVKVVEIERGRVKLSIRDAARDEERQAYKSYQREATSKTVGTSLADKLRGLLNKRG